jgi:hypothetical protein
MSSPVWSLFGNPSTKKFDIALSNISDWSWIDANHKTYNYSSVITMNYWNTSYDNQATYIIMAPSTIGSYLFTLKYFAFGKTYADNSASYQSLLNSVVDNSTFSDKATLALNFRGIGLPSRQFEQFTNLLTVVTQGQATCLQF